MNTKGGVVRGAFSLGGARILINILSAVTLLILARLLTPEDFGVVAIASATLHIVMSVMQFAIYHSLVQRAEVTREHIDTAWTISLIRTVLILSIFLLGAWPLSIAYGDPSMMYIFVITGFTGAAAGVFNPHLVLVTKQMRFGPLTIFQVLQKGTGLILAIILALILGNYWAIIIGNAVGAIAASLLSYFLIPYRPRLCMVHAKELWGFSGWLFYNQVCETINWRFDHLLVSFVVPKAEMGGFAMADSLAAIPTRETIHPLREALFPGLAALNHDVDRMGKSCMRAQSAIAMISMPLGVGLALVAEPAVQVALGEKWISIVPVLQIFAIGYSIQNFVSCLQPTTWSLNRTKLNFLQQFWTMIARIPAIVGGLFFFGLIGAATGRLLSEIVATVIGMIYMKRMLKISVSRQLASHLNTLAGILAMCIAVPATVHFLGEFGFSHLVKFAAGIAVGGLSYLLGIVGYWLVGGRKEGAFHELLHVAGKIIPDHRRPSWIPM